MAALAAGTLSAAGQSSSRAKPVEELIAGIKSTNEAVSSAACQSAPEYGASAVRALAFNMADKDFEVARKATRALRNLVRHAGRPGASEDAAALQTKLLGALQSRRPLPGTVRRELLWLLSEIATVGAVPPIAELLADKELREDARCVLIRLPFREAVGELKQALGNAEEDFKYALADALRARGEKVEGHPTRKMVPTRQTTVAPVAAKK